jgi:uncharacterized membrane protein YidH (DUF202 family)
MNEIGKFLVIVGVIIAAAGALLWSGVGKGWLGRLPGDLHYTRGNFTFYFPIVTCVLLSLALTIILWLFRK